MSFSPIETINKEQKYINNFYNNGLLEITLKPLL